MSELFTEFHKGTEARKASTTMVFVRMLSKLLRDEQIGRLVVPIVPDEARTFGMEALFRQVGIYSHGGQLYEPVDMDTLLYYKEAQDGQILEEGINEAGSMSSFIAAGTAYATHGINTIPFFIFYSMFGFQRIGDLIWAGSDSACAASCSAAPPAARRSTARACSIRTATATCSAMPVPICQAYDPAFAYELAVIIEDGIKRMYGDQENIFYYLTLMNEQYEHPADARRGARRHSQGHVRHGKPTTLPRQQAARSALRQRHDSRRGAQGAEASSRRNTASAPTCGASPATSISTATDMRASAGTGCIRRDKPRVPYVTQSDGECARAPSLRRRTTCKVLPDSIDRWLPRRMQSLGTDGFGRSETRAALRDFFEVDARFIVARHAERAAGREAGATGAGAAGDSRSRDQSREGGSRDQLTSGGA